MSVAPTVTTTLPRQMPTRAPLIAGHTGVHCFDCDGVDDPGTLRLLVGTAAVEYAEHLQTCDDCGSMSGLPCAVGEIKLNTVADLIDGIRGRRDRDR